MQTRTTSPRTRQSTPKVARLHRHDDGAIHALSSNGVARYAVTNTPDGAWSCTCPAGRNGRRCYHVTTAMVRFGGFFPRPVLAVIVPADPDPEPPTPAAPAVRCGDCGQSVPVDLATWQADRAECVCADCLEAARDEAERQYRAAAPARRLTHSCTLYGPDDCRACQGAAVAA